MTNLARSVAQTTSALLLGDLSDGREVRALLEETYSRRSIDLSDMSPTEQAEMIASRAHQLQPGVEELKKRLLSARQESRPFIAKLGIDPTGSEIHLGHAVPMLILSRIQRMGHGIVFVVGDLTAKIGDPSGRSDERPVLTDERIADNISTYRQQVRPFFNFDEAEFRFNSDWLRHVTLPEIINITAQIPVSMSLQREDFRNRLEAGHGLSLAELMYSVVMALDSVEINCDLEIGGIDQFLNMQMCRKVMDICNQTPEIVLATNLIEGTDGSGAKMSKSKGNYIPLMASPDEVFGRIMSIPDHLVEPYLRALSEWQDEELSLVRLRVEGGSLKPVDLKKILAGEITASSHGVEAATSARENFEARFSQKSFQKVTALPVVADSSRAVEFVLRDLGFATSNSHVRRLASQRGIRIVAEDAAGGQVLHVIQPEETTRTLSELVLEKLGREQTTIFLKVGRRLAQVDRRAR